MLSTSKNLHIHFSEPLSHPLTLDHVLREIVSYVEGCWSPMPAHVRRAFLSREGPLSIRDFFKLGITCGGWCVGLIDIDIEQ